MTLPLLSLHWASPLWSCMRPGFQMLGSMFLQTVSFLDSAGRTSNASTHPVVGTRTQPLLSWIMMAKMKRWSTLVSWATA